MTDKHWNPITALRKAVPFFHALPHLSEAALTTCGGLYVLIQYDAYEAALVAYDSDGDELGRVPFVPAE